MDISYLTDEVGWLQKLRDALYRNLEKARKEGGHVPVVQQGAYQDLLDVLLGDQDLDQIMAVTDEGYEDLNGTWQLAWEEANKA